MRFKTRIKRYKIDQFIIKSLWDKHKQINFILSIWDNTKSITTIKDNTSPEYEKIIDITISDKYSKVIWQELNNRDSDDILIKSNSQKKYEQQWIDIDNDTEKNIFNEIVLNNWGEIFHKNKNELSKETNKYKRKQIIDINAQWITDLFTGILKWTVDFTHSTNENIKSYFIHFLEKSPILKWKPEIIGIKKIEDSVVVSKWKYEFELDDLKWWRTNLPAKFVFIFEKWKNWKWTIAWLHSYTD